MSPPSQATCLAEIVDEHFTLHRSEEGQPFALPLDGPRVAVMLRGRGGSLRSRLSDQYRQRNGGVPSQSALTDALVAIEGRALTAPVEPLHLRTARTDDGATVWVDLGRADGESIRITADGWMTATAPVTWRRTKLTGPLPTPAADGDLTLLRQLLNTTDESWPLLAAWMVASWLGVACPVLALLGEHGTGKTSAGRLIVTAVDPSPVPLRTAPRDVESWVVAAAGSVVVGLDNISSIEPWLSDALCRAVTGDGMVRRALYTDDDLSVVAIRRAVVLTAIDPGAMRGDLADRLLAVELALIPDSRRRGDVALTSAWAAAAPEVFAGLADLTASVLSVLPAVYLPRLPRMADFARVLAAVDLVLDTDGLATYMRQRDRLATDAVTSDPVLVALAEHVTDDWVGTSTELLTQITPTEQGWRPPKGWPGSPRAMTAQLKRAAPALRRVGWTVELGYAEDRRAKVQQHRLIPPGREAQEDTRNTRNTREGDISAGQALFDAAGVGAGVAGVDTRTPADTRTNTRTTKPPLSSINGSPAGVAGVAGVAPGTTPDGSLPPPATSAAACTSCGRPASMPIAGRCRTCHHATPQADRGVPT